MKTTDAPLAAAEDLPGLPPTARVQLDHMRREFAALGLDFPEALIEEMARLCTAGEFTPRVGTALVTAYAAGRASCHVEMARIREQVEALVAAMRAADLGVVEQALRTADGPPVRRVSS